MAKRDVEVLAGMRLPVDRLLDQVYRRAVDTRGCARIPRFGPFKSLVTPELVRRASCKAREYVARLLRQKEELGYLYFLNSKSLAVKLNLSFNPKR